MKSSSNRLPAIDALRGFAILGMVLANYAAGIQWIPAWLKHAPDIGYTITDLVAPLFIFAIGLTYGLSAQARLRRDGAWKMAMHFITRFFAILGIGAVLGAGEILLQIDGQTVNWGVLQAIGVAGLITLVFIRTGTFTRLVSGLAILALYQYMLDHFWRLAVLSSPHGGLYGALSWGSMLLLSTALADFYHRKQHNKRAFLGAVMLVLLAGLMLSQWIPISKNRVSATYVLISLGLSGLLFALFHLLVENCKMRLSLLVKWGKNPLVLYVLHLLLLGFVALPDLPGWYQTASVWLVVVQASMLLGLLTLAAWLMERRRLFVRL